MNDIIAEQATGIRQRAAKRNNTMSTKRVYIIIKYGRNNVPAEEIDRDTPTPGERVTENALALDAALNNYHTPWEDYQGTIEAARAQLADSLRAARKLGWRFLRNNQPPKADDMKRRHTLHTLVNRQDEPETWPQYLRRLADDCEESGNDAHAKDHRTSATLLDALARHANALAEQIEAWRAKYKLNLPTTMKGQINQVKFFCERTQHTDKARAFMHEADGFAFTPNWQLAGTLEASDLDGLWHMSDESITPCVNFIDAIHALEYVNAGYRLTFRQKHNDHNTWDILLADTE